MRDNESFLAYEPEENPHEVSWGDVPVVHMKDKGRIEIIGSRFGYHETRIYRCKQCGEVFTSLDRHQYGTESDYAYYKDWDERMAQLKKDLGNGTE